MLLVKILLTFILIMVDLIRMILRIGILSRQRYAIH